MKHQIKIYLTNNSIASRDAQHIENAFKTKAVANWRNLVPSNNVIESHGHSKTLPHLQKTSHDPHWLQHTFWNRRSVRLLVWICNSQGGATESGHDVDRRREENEARCVASSRSRNDFSISRNNRRFNGRTQTLILLQM